MRLAWDWKYLSLQRVVSLWPDGRPHVMRELFALKCGLCRRWSMGCAEHWFCGMCPKCGETLQAGRRFGMTR